MAKADKQYKVGGVFVSRWDGDKGVSFSCSRAYKDKDGDFKYTSFMGINDLFKLRFAIDKALEDYFTSSGKQSRSNDGPSDDLPAF